MTSVLTALGGVGTSLAGSSSAEPRPAFEDYAPDVPEGMTKADLEEGERLENAVATVRSTNRGSGYTAVIPDRERQELTVLWKAPLPKGVAALDGADLHGFKVNVQDALYSQEDLLEAGEKVLSASRAKAIPNVTSVTGLRDGSGLEVGVLEAELLANGIDGPAAEAIEQVSGMPVRVVPGEESVPMSRQNDSSPWYGGGMMEAPGFNPPDDMVPFLFCSTGFAVVTDGGAGRLLSAKHCDDDTSPICDRDWKDGHHDDLTNGGADVDCAARDDSMLIDPIGGTDGWVHGGPQNATSSHSRYHLKVAGAARSFNDEVVCSSGANSGEHCDLRIQNVTMIQWNCGPAPGSCWGWWARRNWLPLGIASVGGDSGGPVYHPRTDGRVGARGIMWGSYATSDSVPCPDPPAVRFAISNCSSTIKFTDIVDITTNVWTTVTVETTP